MANHTSIPGFARALNAYAKAAEKGTVEGVNAAALILKRAVEADVKSAVGADMQMSNAGSVKTRAKGGAPLKVRYDVVGKYRAVAAIYAMTKAGPWKLLEGGSPKHAISPSVNNQLGSGKNAKKQRTANLRARRNSKRYGLGFESERVGRVALGGTAGFLGNKAQGFGAAYVTNHPGTKGRRLFIPAVERAIPRAKQVRKDKFIQALFNEAKKGI